jgi:serine/threonine protein kinase
MSACCAIDAPACLPACLALCVAVSLTLRGMSVHAHKHSADYGLQGDDIKGFRAKISDFGLSQHMTKDQNYVLVSKGTEAYLPVEVFQNLALTEKSDVYAMGLLMWEIFYGIFWHAIYEEEKKRKGCAATAGLHDTLDSLNASVRAAASIIMHAQEVLASLLLKARCSTTCSYTHGCARTRAPPLPPMQQSYPGCTHAASSGPSTWATITPPATRTAPRSLRRSCTSASAATRTAAPPPPTSSPRSMA